MTATAYGWRIERVPAKPVRRGEDGRVSVPLWLTRDGVYHSDLDLRLSPDEAQTLHAQLSHALDGDDLLMPKSTRETAGRPA